MPLGKLIKENRSVYVYQKTKSKYQGDHLDEINVNHIDLERLKEIVVAYPDDPYLLYTYELDKMQIEKLNTYLENKIIAEKNKQYLLECYGKYEK